MCSRLAAIWLELKERNKTHESFVLDARAHTVFARLNARSLYRSSAMFLYMGSDGIQLLRAFDEVLLLDQDTRHTFGLLGYW